MLPSVASVSSVACRVVVTEVSLSSLTSLQSSTHSYGYGGFTTSTPPPFAHPSLFMCAEDSSLVLSHIHQVVSVLVSYGVHVL